MIIVPRRNKVINGKLIKEIFSYILSKNKRKYNYIKILKEELAKFTGSKYALLLSSGRQGLSLIIDYYSFPKGSEIILPAYTLKNLALIIKEKGYIPIFADINPRTFNMEASGIEKKISKNTAMIIATHMFGMPCEIDKIVELGRKHKIAVIEDCAHTMGSRYKGNRVGTFGEASFFSLETSKPINTFGGGVVITNKANINNYIKNKIEKYPKPKFKLLTKVLCAISEDLIIHSLFFSVIVFLFYFKYTKKLITHLYVLFHGKVNITYFKYTNFQAFLGVSQLNDLDNRNKTLMEKVFHMRDYLDKSIYFQENLYGSIPAFYFNLIKTDTPCWLMRKRLLWKGIDVGIKDEIADNCPMLFKNESSYPVIADCYDKLLQLPMSYNTNILTIKRIADAVNSSLD